MKKRIGTKLFDTETSDLICGSDIGQIFRKKTGLGEYFACDGTKIIPLEYETAKEIVKTNAPDSYDKLFTIRNKDTTKKPVMISLSEYDKAKLRKLSAQKKMSMSEYIVWLMEQDEKRMLK